MASAGEVAVPDEEAIVDEVDPYACDACLAVEDICVFHSGFAVGWDACAAAVARFAAEDDDAEGWS